MGTVFSSFKFSLWEVLIWLWLCSRLVRVSLASRCFRVVVLTSHSSQFHHGSTKVRFPRHVRLWPPRLGLLHPHPSWLHAFSSMLWCLPLQWTCYQALLLASFWFTVVIRQERRRWLTYRWRHGDGIIKLLTKKSRGGGEEPRFGGIELALTNGWDRGGDIAGEGEEECPYGVVLCTEDRLAVRDVSLVSACSTC